MKTKIGVSVLITAVFFIYNLNLCLAQAFTPPTVVVDSIANKYVQQFITVYKNNIISGGVITREALDNILKTQNCNAITYRLGVDTTGVLAPKNEIFIILSGAKATESHGSVTLLPIAAPKYVPRHWCPPSCMSLSQIN